MSRTTNQRILIMGAAFMVFLTAGLMLVLLPEHSETATTASNRPVALPPTGAACSSATPSSTVPSRPLPVSRSTARHQWTSADAASPEIIARLAHNAEEARRLTEENARIKRRQLVYRNETLPMLLQRSGGQALKEFILPGLDGREMEVEVLEARLNGLVAGSIMGRVKGVPNSLVSVGFCNGCESFNVSLPDEGLYLAADAREPGEVLVKEIDPAVYAPPTRCEPIVIE